MSTQFEGILDHQPVTTETMPQMPCLKDVSREWEQDSDLREHMRRSRTILQWDDPEDKKVNIRNADLNFQVLRPLVKRLRDDSGEVGMHALPGLMSQPLGQTLVQVHFKGAYSVNVMQLTPFKPYDVIANK